MKKILFLVATYCFFSQVLIAQNSKTDGEESAFFIQIASFADPQYNDFKKIQKLGYLYSVPLDNGILRVMMGTYSSQSAANQKLNQIKAQGYKDAFTVRVPVLEQDAVYIVQLATFDLSDDIQWSEWQTLAGNKLCAQLSDHKVRLAVGPFFTEEEAYVILEKIRDKSPKDIFVKRVSSKVLHEVLPFEMSRSTNTPSSKGEVRPSVKALQQLLTKEAVYKDRIDGVWDKPTFDALQRYKSTNEQYQKYQLIANQMSFSKPVEPYSLQYYINMIEEKPYTADEGLKQLKHPLAKVYRAYMYLNGDIDVPESQSVIDDLMHQAISQVFKNYKQKTRSDFTMQYSYKETSQLIRHLREIHEAVADEPEVPCWLFQRHYTAATEAFAPYWNNDRDLYQISSDCGSFFDAPEMKVLLAIGNDFATDAQLMHQNQHILSSLYVMPTALNPLEGTLLEKWNFDLWRSLGNWASGSALQQKLHGVLQIAYADAMRVLEDYFAKKGFFNLDTRVLALKVLKLSVGCSLDEYCGKTK